MSSDLNVYQRFSMACNIIDGQQWVLDMENRQYKSIPIDKMRAGVRKACVKAGIVHVGPYDIEYEKSVNDRTVKYTGSCKFRYVNIDNPEEWIEFESIGEANDNGDKGVGKFVTNCIKNHYKAAFDIGEQGKDDIDEYSNEEFDEQTAKLKTEEDGRKKASACKKAIEDWLNDDPLVNASNEIIADYVGRFGIMSDWKGGSFIQCYKELKDSGIKLAEVKL